MPLNPIQAQIAKLLAVNRAPDSYLAGGAALHFKPNTLRYSQDLDYFHDTVERVAQAFEKDESLLKKSGYNVEVEMKQPGYLRAQVEKSGDSTKIEWAHDTVWRFMPVLRNEDCGYQLDPIDISINKLLALVGRDEARDFLDILYIHREILSLGALCWAAAGKDPGFTPWSLLELLRRRGKVQPEELNRLRLKEKANLPKLKTEWLKALEDAEKFIESRPLKEMGCLYYASQKKKFFAPSPDQQKPSAKSYACHYGRPGGVLPHFL